MFQQRNLLPEVHHQRITSWEIFLQKLSVSKLHLNFEPSSENLFLALLSRVILPLQDVGFAHLVPGIVQNHLDLLECWILTAFLKRNPSSLVDALLAVEVSRVDADESLRVGVKLVRVEGTQLRLGGTSHWTMLRLRSETCDGGHTLTLSEIHNTVTRGYPKSVFLINIVTVNVRHNVWVCSCFLLL